jgi:hypothetical protein
MLGLSSQFLASSLRMLPAKLPTLSTQLGRLVLTVEQPEHRFPRWSVDEPDPDLDRRSFIVREALACGRLVPLALKCQCGA